MKSSYEKRDYLTDIFSALAHPVRRDILDMLKSGKATVKDLAEPFDMSMPAITKHLKVLENVGLINRSKEGQWRFSHLDPKPLKKASNWLDDYRQLWNEQLDRLEDYLGKLQTKGENND